MRNRIAMLFSYIWGADMIHEWQSSLMSELCYVIPYK